MATLLAAAELAFGSAEDGSMPARGRIGEYPIPLVSSNPSSARPGEPGRRLHLRMAAPRLRAVSVHRPSGIPPASSADAGRDQDGVSIQHGLGVTPDRFMARAFYNYV